MKKTFFIFLFSAILFWNSCDDNSAENTSVDFQFEFLINSEPLELGKTYTLNGTTVQFDVAAFYLGGITFEQTAGDNAIFEDKYLLVNAAESVYNVGDFDFGDYTSLSMYVGVDALNNSQTEEDFTTRAADDPLALQSPQMHWSWANGYKFIRFDGMTDTDADGVVDTPLAFHIGNDNMLRNVTYTLPALQEGANMIDFTLDINQLYDGIDLAVDWDTHTDNNLPLAEKFVANFTNALQLN